MTADEQNPVGTRRQQQKAETRALILDAARRLFAERGFDGTTVRAVAAGAGVGLGTIFKHFPDKSSLLIATMIEDLGELEARVLGVLRPGEPLDAQLRTFLVAVFGFWGERPSLARVLLREAWFAPGPWGQRYRDETLALIDRAAALLADAQRAGALRADADPRALAQAIYASYLFAMIRDVDTPRFDPEALADEVQVAFCLALAGGTGPGGTAP